LIIGCAQAVAVLPGISRSGATISTSLLLGVDRSEAARFSFLMVLPPILGATALEVKDLFVDPSLASGVSVSALIAAAIAAFFSGWWACRKMLELVKRNGLNGFAVYCALAGALAWVLSL
jgi:undecaprenyl-diphosphatase